MNVDCDACRIYYVVWSDVFTASGCLCFISNSRFRMEVCVYMCVCALPDEACGRGGVPALGQRVQHPTLSGDRGCARVSRCYRVFSSADRVLLRGKSVVCTCVPQGSVFGPLLWDIGFVGALCSPLPLLSVACYANDTLVVARYRCDSGPFDVFQFTRPTQTQPLFDIDNSGGLTVSMYRGLRLLRAAVGPCETCLRLWHYSLGLVYW